jgi:hypothetical protein
MRIAELQATAELLAARTRDRDPASRGALSLIERHLELARRAAEGEPRLMRRIAAYLFGSEFARVSTHLDAAEAELLRLAPAEYVRGQVGTVLATVRVHLPSGHPQRTRMEQVAARSAAGELTAADRDTMVAAYRTAQNEVRSAIVRIRSFRSVVLVVASVLTLAAAGVAVLGSVRPSVLPLCYVAADRVVCPTDETPIRFGTADVDEAVARTATVWDLPLVLLLGAIGASIAAATALRAIRGTSTPYSVPIALALLKIPTGALTAVVGLLLIKGQFVPGLSALDSSAQILAYAALFGFGQQLFTRFVDQQARDLLEAAGDAPPELSTGAAAVTPEAVAGEVATTVRRSLAPSPLANYRGTLSVRVLDDQGAPLPISEDGDVIRSDRVADHVEITIGPTPEVEAIHAPVTIERGEDVSRVAFEVEIEGLDYPSGQASHIIEVEPGGAAERVGFSLPRGSADGSIWVRLMQRGRLIQLVEIGIG